MTDTDFTELQGRIDGLARAYLLLSYELEHSGLIDRSGLQALLRTHAAQLTDQQAVVQHYLTALADEMRNMYRVDNGLQ